MILLRFQLLTLWKKGNKEIMKSSLKKILPAFIALLLFISCEQTPADFLNKQDFFNEPKRFKSEQEFNDSKLEFTEQSQNGYSFVILFNPEKDNELLLDNSFRIYYSHKIDSEYKVTLETLNQEPLTYEVIDKSPLVITLNEQDKQSVLQNGLVIKYKGIQINNILNSSDESESNDDDVPSERTVVFERNQNNRWSDFPLISKYSLNQVDYHAGQYLELTVTGVPDADVNEVNFIVISCESIFINGWSGINITMGSDNLYPVLVNLRKDKQFNYTALIKCDVDGNTDYSALIMEYGLGTDNGTDSDWGWSTNQFDRKLTIKDFTISVKVYDNPLHWNIAYDENLKKQTLYIDCDSVALPYFNTAHIDGGEGSTAPWTGHESEYDAVVFGDNIEVITNAFYLAGDGHTVDYIHLPNNVKVLGINSFCSTRSLEQLYIPASVEYIGYHSFMKWSGCTQYLDWPESENSSRILTGLEYDNGGTYNFKTTDDNNSFSYKNGVLTVNSDIGSSFFTDNQINSSEVTNIIIGKNVTVIDNETFKQCKNLTTVDFSQSENLTEIGEDAFYGCPVEEIDLSGCKYLTTIGNYAFSNCADLTKVTIPASVEKLGSYTFSKCSSLTEVVFSGTSSLTELGSYTFNNCKQLQSLTLPETIKGMGGYNFYGCINLPYIILSEGVAESQYDGQGINGDNNFSGWPKNHPVYLNYTREQDHNSSRRYGDATIVYKDEKVIIVEYISDNGTAGILESYASGASSQSSLMQVSSANKEFGGWYTEPELINKVEDVPGLFRLQQSAATSDNTNPLTGGVVVRLKLYAEWKDLQ